MNNKDFYLAEPAIEKTANDFYAEIKNGLDNKLCCSLKLLPSFFGRASGHEKGRFLSLDFGGTNIRASVIQLEGAGRYTILAEQKASLEHVLLQKITGEGLFDFIAQMIARLVGDREIYLLGHTFSFPSRQIDANTALLLEWTKELKIHGVVGRDINKMLAEALVRQNRSNVRPVAILNDTVATLLTASYSDRFACVGSICGTGHNSAFFNVKTNSIINMESGNFNRLQLNIYDKILDIQSNNTHGQCLEKMVAGRYLGELFRLALNSEQWPYRYSISGEMLSDIIRGLREDFTVEQKTLAENIIKRAAKLVAATYLGTIKYLDRDLKEPHTIAVDGSLYEKMPLYAEYIQKTMMENLGADMARIKIVGETRGSVLGGALAAAVCAKVL